MKNASKKPQTTTTAPDASALLEAAHAADAEAAALGAAHAALIRSGSGASDLERVLGEIAWRSAQDRADEARAAALAARTSDPEEVALAAACDPSRLREDYMALADISARGYAQYRATVDRRNARVSAAFAAHAALSQRRSEQGLPAPAPLPEFNDEHAFPDALRAAEVAIPTSKNAGQIDRLRGEETRIRADLERARIEEEDREADRVALRAQRDEQEASERKRIHAEIAAAAAVQAAERAETERLADAHRARVG
jgi:hypothetical protein